ncbi:hypothetical protein [Bacillus sp. BP-3]|uniref:hypothetical protein n=1 Tax=Bacillus sp. BP-3 TaxID=3022773 RepID=UPI00233059B5|nr:hypothetical protein [Bacillus sp. BP-3]MDC2863847.1 hypothetical protein [Bacillus sp. BP-3]
MKKADKVHELVFDYLLDIKHPNMAVRKKNESIVTLVLVLSTMAKGTRYEEDVYKLIEEADKHIYD